jgi:hypothetical protein
MSNQSNSDSTVRNSIDSEEESDHWKQNRRASINLLDMTDIPSVEPNVIPLCEGADLLDKDKNKSKPSIHKFDPLAEKSSVVAIETEEKPPLTMATATKVMPTRLPTPKRPISYSSFELTQDKSSPSIQLDPTPPSSPGRRVRHTSIARLVKSASGKANRELAEFDPLISTNNKMETSKDPSCPSKKGAQVIV